MKKVVVVGAILAVSLLLFYLVFITLNGKKEPEGSLVRGQVDIAQASVQPGARPGVHKKEPVHTKFYHPAKPEELWESMDEKRLVVRRLAYYDTRIDDHPAIMFNAMYDLRHAEKPNVFVELRYSDKPTKCLQLEYKSQSGSLSDVMQEFYVYFLLWTKDPVKERPETVALTLDKDCGKDKLSSSISVQGLVPGPNAVKYAVCLHKALFGISDPQVVVDWVEINRELGAELLMLYYQDVPEIMYTILQPYIETGLLEVIDWSLKEPSIPKMHTLDNGMSAVINECIYRSMNRVKYLSLTDIDEFIVPESKFEKVGDMMEYLEEKTKSKPVSAYRFHNTYYFEDPVSVPQVKDMSFCSKMKLPRYFRRTQRATHAEKYGSDKLVVKTRAVNVVQVHFVVDKQKEYEAEYEVPNDIGRSNHYRWPYRMADFTPHEYSDIMGRYAGTVIPRIKSVMCKSDKN